MINLNRPTLGDFQNLVSKMGKESPLKLPGNLSGQNVILDGDGKTRCLGVIRQDGTVDGSGIRKALYEAVKGSNVSSAFLTDVRGELGIGPGEKVSTKPLSERSIRNIVGAFKAGGYVKTENVDGKSVTKYNDVFKRGVGRTYTAESGNEWTVVASAEENRAGVRKLIPGVNVGMTANYIKNAIWNPAAEGAETFAAACKLNPNESANVINDMKQGLGAVCGALLKAFLPLAARGGAEQLRSYITYGNNPHVLNTLGKLGDLTAETRSRLLEGLDGLMDDIGGRVPEEAGQAEARRSALDVLKSVLQEKLSENLYSNGPVKKGPEDVAEDDANPHRKQDKISAFAENLKDGYHLAKLNKSDLDIDSLREERKWDVPDEPQGQKALDDSDVINPYLEESNENPYLEDLKNPVNPSANEIRENEDPFGVNDNPFELDPAVDNPFLWDDPQEGFDKEEGLDEENLKFDSNQMIEDRGWGEVDDGGVEMNLKASLPDGENAPVDKKEDKGEDLQLNLGNEIDSDEVLKREVIDGFGLNAVNH